MTDAARILIVEDDPNWLEIYEMELEDDTYSIDTAKTIEEVLGKINTNIFDVVVTDLRLIGDYQGGINILKSIKKEKPDIQVIIFTAYGSSEDAQQALKDGAYDYLRKPLDYDHARLIIRAAIEVRRQYLDGIVKRKQQIEGKLIFPERFLYSATPMRNVVHLAAKQAEGRENILIIGSSGTGKGLLAEAIHFGSKRSNFMLVNCASLSEQTLERILFGGNVEGENWQQGYLQSFSAGTIVLDNVSSLSERLQLMLLNALKMGIASSIDDNPHIEIVYTRIIALDNIEISELVNDGLFLHDLYECLAKTVIRVPALRERKDEQYNDITHLAQYFITKYGVKPYPELAPDAKEVLKAYYFPGNVRELQMIIRKAIAKAKHGKITVEHLPINLILNTSTLGVGVASTTNNESIVCPHGNFYCDQLETIQASYKTKKLVYLRTHQKSLSGLGEQAHQIITSLGFSVQRHVNTEGKRVIHCKYCMPIQMSRYAIIDLINGDTDLVYELGLLHTLGIPTLLLKEMDRELNEFLMALNASVYTSTDDARKIINGWLKDVSMKSSN